MDRKLRFGMMGGGQGSFIGRVHHMAAVLDNEMELVCGAFSSDPEKSKASGKEYYLPPERVYGTYQEMIEKEKKLPGDKRMDFVAIVTPNHLHYEQARLALENGFHVVCDKPLAYSLDEALKLQDLLSQKNLLFALTHAYTGYPMVKEAREIVKEGKLGKIRKILVEYPQGWLAENIEKEGQKQASWRTDPKKAGISCTMGDIGVHAANLAEYISGLDITALSADLNTFVEGRPLDDDGSVLLQFEEGARGALTASQICTGEENALKIQVYGEKGGLEWHQMEPNSLILKWLDRPTRISRTGTPWLSEAAKLHSRVPAGHPEGYIEAFANIYRNFAIHLKKQLNGEKAELIYDFPSIHEGVRGMAFIEASVHSAEKNGQWIVLGGF
jgi:predicted dehydrogenase